MMRKGIVMWRKVAPIACLQSTGRFTPGCAAGRTERLESTSLGLPGSTHHSGWMRFISIHGSAPAAIVCQFVIPVKIRVGKCDFGFPQPTNRAAPVPSSTPLGPCLVGVERRNCERKARRQLHFAVLAGLSNRCEISSSRGGLVIKLTTTPATTEAGRP